MKTASIFLIILFITMIHVMSMPQNAHCQEISFGFSGGFMTNPGDCYDSGYSIGGKIYYHLKENIEIGGRLNWDRNENADAFCLAGSPDILAVIEEGGGELTITEIIPSLRLNLQIGGHKRNLIFLETGV